MNRSFDTDLAGRMGSAFSKAVGVGCALCAGEGEALSASGYTRGQSALCGMLCQSKGGCDAAHLQAVQAALRAGGRYVYLCPGGLGFAVSPIVAKGRCEAWLQAGPFLMVDPGEYLTVELLDILKAQPEKEEELLAVIRGIPHVDPSRVVALSDMLHMAACHLSGAEDVAGLRLREASSHLQGQLSAYIARMKEEKREPLYPYAVEDSLLEAVTQNRRQDANRYLNELLSNILIMSGMSFPRMKSHINELMVLLSRKALMNGADAQRMQQEMYDNYQRLIGIATFDELCWWLKDIVNRMMTYIFDPEEVNRNKGLQRALVFIRANLHKRLTLEEVAKEAFLSPAYFSRLFKQEVGKTVQQFLVDERLKRAIELMYNKELTLLEIGEIVGVRNQGLLNRLFRKNYGVSPGTYRARLLRRMQQREGT